MNSKANIFQSRKAALAEQEDELCQTFRAEESVCAQLKGSIVPTA